jgi:hypothetical protein
LNLLNPPVERLDPPQPGKDEAEAALITADGSVIDEQAIKHAVETAKARLAEPERMRARRLVQPPPVPLVVVRAA